MFTPQPEPDEDAAPVEIPDHPDNDPPPPTDFAPVEIPDHPDNDPPPPTDFAPVEVHEDVYGGPEGPPGERDDTSVELVEPEPPAPVDGDERYDPTGLGDLSSDTPYAEQEAELLEPGREQVSHHMSGIPSPGPREYGDPSPDHPAQGDAQVQPQPDAQVDEDGFPLAVDPPAPESDL